MVQATFPKKLYKYQSFGVNALKAICNGEVFYASPAQFNDPLDCHPVVSIDVDIDQLEDLWRHLMSSRHDQAATANLMAGHRYAATEFGLYDDGNHGSRCYIGILKGDIARWLHDEYKGNGVLSLASRWNCPLMWSHYADEHRGICIEYSTDNHQCSILRPVSYHASRLILASELIDWKIGNAAVAGRTIFEKYFYAKAPQWKYEKEWRQILNISGPSPAPFLISAIYFGMRCDYSVQSTVVRLLMDHAKSTRFYSIYVRDNGFKLDRELLNVGEVNAMAVRSSPLFDFEDIA